MIFILGLVVGAMLAVFCAWAGYNIGVWISGPPEGFQLIVMPKTTRLIIKADGVRIVHNPLWGSAEASEAEKGKAWKD